MPTRDLMMKGSNGEVDPIEGVVLVSRKLANRENVRIVVQVALELRYGREDEELMGLQFCNEMILASETLLPLPCDYVEEFDTQGEDLSQRYGCFLKPFKINIGCSLPPTIRLQPTRNYAGSPIGTTYTISVFPTYTETMLSPPDKKELIHMMFWVSEVFPEPIDIRPTMSISRRSIFKDGQIFLQVGLDRNTYTTGQPINISVVLEMKPPRRITRISVVAIQAVDVAMFSSGYFKNEVATAEERLGHAVDIYNKTFTIVPKYIPGKHWIAVADSNKEGKGKHDHVQKLAASVMIKERSLFIIKVMYFIQVKVSTGPFQTDLVLKIPFLLAPEGKKS